MCACSATLTLSRRTSRRAVVAKFRFIISAPGWSTTSQEERGFKLASAKNEVILAVRRSPALHKSTLEGVQGGAHARPFPLPSVSRPRYSRLSVSILMRSPSLMNCGTEMM
eukprot:scaffold17945_cov68-Phaeocystis_antarctica.AAC.5